MTPVCTLPAELTIYTIGELHPQCLAWVDANVANGTEAPEVLAVAADGVAEVDAAGVQLLLSLAHTLAARQRRLELAVPSAVLAAACAALGAEALLAVEGACA